MTPRDHPQDITHWVKTGRNGFGAPIFATPDTIAGRWEDKAELFMDGEGRQLVSRAMVYLESAVFPGDYLLKGISTQADPTLLDNAFEVRQYQEVPDLRNLSQERVAFL